MKNIQHYSDKKSFNDVLRKRLVIELIADSTHIPFSKKFITDYMIQLSKIADMTIIHGPFVGSYAKDYKPDYYDGIEGHMIWAESGCQVYTWDRFNAVTIDIYTCKDFDIQKMITFTRTYFNAQNIAYRDIEPILTLK